MSRDSDDEVIGMGIDGATGRPLQRPARRLRRKAARTCGCAAIGRHLGTCRLTSSPTSAKTRSIIAAVRAGSSQTEIAALYGISRPAVTKMVSRHAQTDTRFLDETVTPARASRACGCDLRGPHRLGCPDTIRLAASGNMIVNDDLLRLLQRRGEALLFTPPSGFEIVRRTLAQEPAR